MDPTDAGWDGIHAVAEDLSLAALCLEEHVLLLDGAGRQLALLPHQPTGPYDQGCCVFADDGRHLWATVTWVDVLHEVPPRLGEGGDELWLIDLATRSVVDRRRLDTGAAVYLPVRHPDGQTIGLCLIEAEEGGSDLYWARVDGGRISLRHSPDRHHIQVAVHPGGGEYLTTPNIDAGAANELRRHRFVDDQPVEALPLPASVALGQEVWWDDYAGYLTDELILAGTTGPERHVLVQRQPLRLLASVAYPAGDRPGWLCPCGDGSWLCPCGDGSWLCPCGDGSWLTVGAGRVQRWLLG